jgi:hypothetical protein
MITLHQYHVTHKSRKERLQRLEDLHALRAQAAALNLQLEYQEQQRLQKKSPLKLFLCAVTQYFSRPHRQQYNSLN